MKIRRLSYAIGAEIIGIDVRRPLDDKTFSKVHAAFLDHGILLFRGQAVTREQHIAFSRRFGVLDNNDTVPRDRDPECHEIKYITNKPRPDAAGQGGAKQQNSYAGKVWHSDRAFSSTPAMATLLRNVEVPEIGGDTMFANMYLAYESLSDGMKKLIEGLHGVHRGAEAETRRLNPPVAHPLVRVHPETGRKSIFLEEKVEQLAGMTAEESKPLIQFLCNHATRPQFVYRHQWEKDDLLIWDNRCTLHIALADFDRDTQTRHMEKTVVLGTPSGYAYDGTKFSAIQ